MKNQLLTLAALGLAVTMAACNNDSNTEARDSITSDSAAMKDTAMAMPADTTTYNAASAAISGTKADTTVSGTASFVRKDDKVELTLTLDIPKKANSSVAVHIHEHGDCGDMGEGAHGHWNPTNDEHGKWGAAKFHAGDIGNISLDKTGKATLKIETDLWTIGGPEKTNILNRAIIVHSGVDDYVSQPSGKSGSRIGCGVISKK